MKWNTAPETISLAILGIIWVYSREGGHIPSLKNRTFQGCLTITFAAMTSNILSTLMLYRYISLPLWLTWAVTTVYFILTPLMGLIYYLYMVFIIYEERPRLRQTILTGSIPTILYTTLVLSNSFTGCMSAINSDQGYVRDGCILLTYLIFYAHYIACIVVMVRNRYKIDRRTFHILAAFSVLTVLVILSQQLYLDIILSGFAATCALLIIYLHLRNKQISMDYLTGVPDRQELLNMLDLMFKKYPDKEFTLMVVSIRDLRQVNNICGQHSGDGSLKSVCRFLYETGPRENVYRYNGDEFALLFTDGDGERIRRCMGEIQERMAKPWRNRNYQFTLPVVTGIVRWSEYVNMLEKVVSAIEYAVYQTKIGKCGEVLYCDRSMLGKLERRKRVTQILGDQLAGGDVEIYYQPIYCVDSGKFMYAESLMRMNNTPIGPVYPSESIPIAEETGLIIKLIYLVPGKMCKYINRPWVQGLPIEAIYVNFSVTQFSQPDLTVKVLDIIQHNGTPMFMVKLGFTESTLAESPQVVTDFAAETKRHGTIMGLDDLGTGYSNIVTVISIPFGTIESDKGLVWVPVSNQISALTVKHLVETFEDLGMAVVAEGVETEEQKQLVIDFGVEQIQGYYYSKPLSQQGMEEFLRKNEGYLQRRFSVTESFIMDES